MDGTRKNRAETRKNEAEVMKKTKVVRSKHRHSRKKFFVEAGSSRVFNFYP